MICTCSSFPGSYVFLRPFFEQRKIFGTWDFKWPIGRQIKVAFQQLPNDSAYAKVNFQELIERVQALANTWNLGKGNPPFKFVSGTLPPPPSPKEPLGKSDLSKAGNVVDYDVLVSFAQLPIEFPVSNRVAPDLGSKDLFKQEVSSFNQLFPTSQLGRFALRANYGVPTVYLGMPARDPKNPIDARNLLSVAGEKDPSADRVEAIAAALPENRQTVEQYFAHVEFESTVVHEFGHVLGVPHVHQSPLARPRWRSIADLVNLVRAGTGVNVDEGFIKAQILLQWPSSRSRHGEVLFSDWSTFDRAGSPLLKFDPKGDPITDSVMNHPLWQLLLVEQQPPVAPAPSPAMASPRAAAAPSAPILGKVERLTEPTAMDRQLLATMYSY